MNDVTPKSHPDRSRFFFVSKLWTHRLPPHARHRPDEKLGHQRHYQALNMLVPFPLGRDAAAHLEDGVKEHCGPNLFSHVI